MIWIAILFVAARRTSCIFKTPIGLRIRACGEHPRAADTVGINVYAVRYGAVILSGILAAMGGAYLTVGYLNTYNENMTAGRGFIALAALIFGNWRPFGAFGGGAAVRLLDRAGLPPARVLGQRARRSSRRCRTC